MQKKQLKLQKMPNNFETFFVVFNVQFHVYHILQLFVINVYKYIN